MILAQVPSEVPHLTYQVSWEKLPEDYLLPDEPVENTSQRVERLESYLRDQGIDPDEIP